MFSFFDWDLINFNTIAIRFVLIRSKYYVKIRFTNWSFFKPKARSVIKCSHVKIGSRFV